MALIVKSSIDILPWTELDPGLTPALGTSPRERPCLKSEGRGLFLAAFKRAQIFSD